MARLKAGQKLGKYRIRRRLAEGGFAQIYRAFDSVEGVEVALKIPHGHLVTPSMLEGFKREVRLAAGLDHPNILPIKNAQYIDGHFAVAYPLGTGTLHDRMRRRLSMTTRIDLAEQILEAVAFAHARRVMHLDLKPENLILFPGHRLRLTDFGISKLAARTVVASGSGTVGYVAPEQAMGRASFRSDVFSLGLILYELFSGELPEWPFEWPLVGLERLKRRVHPDFIAFLRRAMEVDQSRRYADAQRMLAAFRRLKARGRIEAPPARARRRKRTTARNGLARDWREMRRRQFQRTWGKVLGASHHCGRCRGPVSEPMTACPWCGAPRPTHRGRTRFPARCPRCRRGRKLDWRWCAWCFGPGFRRVSERTYSDSAYGERCANPACDRRVMMRFMRYCPWCRTKERRGWKVPGSRASCSRCGWGVLSHYWSFCPWCGKEQPVR